MVERRSVPGKQYTSQWLKCRPAEAKDLIRSILQIEPTRRLSIEGILRHRWFSKTIVDPPLDSIPGVEGSVTPFLHSPDYHISGYFSEARFDGPRTAFRPVGDLSGSAVLSNNGSPLASPSKESAASFIDPSDTYIGPYGERHSSTSSSKSDTGSARTSASSGNVHGSENATTSSTITTPSTPVFAETAGSKQLVVEDAADDTPRAEHTTDKLAYEHSNTSQSTIRRSDEAARSRPSSMQAMNKGRVQVLAKQLEEDEEYTDSQSRRQSFTNYEEHALHLPLAQHSRTPNRTKRRSVSSTLSDRRPSMARGNSNVVQPVPNVDYLAQLNAVPAPFFSSKEEQDLLALLKIVGVDVGQLQHSVNHNACDASSAMWWMLRAKQREQAADFAHHNDQHQLAEQSVTRPPSGGNASGGDAAHCASETQSTNIRRTFELGAPLPPLPQTLSRKQSVSPNQDSATKDDAPASAGKTAGQQPSQITESFANLIVTSSPSTPRADPHALIADVEALKPADDSAPSSPSKKREGAKSRSTSFSMLQRATSAFTTGNLTRKKSDEKILEQVAASNQAGLERARSPNKLHKIPRNRENSTVDERDAPALQVSAMTAPRKAPTPPILPTSTSHGTLNSMTSMTSTSTSVDESPSKGKEGKNRKRESFLNTFRSWFVEDKRRKQRPPTVSAPTLHVANNAHVIRRPPGYQPNNSTFSRRSGPPRRTPSDQRPALHSRRSSSINSRRSSVTMDLPVGSPLDTYGPRRRGSLSRRSAGSRTPTSERGEFFSNSGNSRPSSVHSFSATIKAPIPRHIETRKSSSAVSDTPSRMSHNRSPGVKHYQRVTTSSPAARSRHARFTSHTGTMGHLDRAASTTSSHRSNASSRRSSGEYSGQHGADDKDDEIELQDDMSSVHSTRRKRTGHERYVYPSSRRIRSPHGSSTSLATMVFPKPKRPIRDVFAKKKGNDGLTDDDWVSDEEEGAYAGGLGQCGSNINKAATVGDIHWKPRGGSGFDTARNQDSPVMKTSSLMSSVVSRTRPRTNRVEPPRTGKPTENAGRNVNNPSQDWVRPTRVQMPVARPVRIVEEDEEEEE